jgi:biotin carboxylase
LGLVDALHAVGISAFGPTRAAAQIESSKSFAKDFMHRYAIPTASYGVFTEYAQALHFLEEMPGQAVIKASGLAAGKGVYLPDSPAEAGRILHELLVEQNLGKAGTEVVIEERLEGEEVSLLAFSDGQTIRCCPRPRITNVSKTVTRVRIPEGWALTPPHRFVRPRWPENWPPASSNRPSMVYARMEFLSVVCCMPA